MKPHIGTEILEQTEEPGMLFVALVALPDAGDTKHRAALREEVKHEQVASLHTVNHRRTRILRPSLNHPYRLGIDAFHRLHHRLTGLGIVDIRVVVALVEGVHRVIIGLSEEFGELIII